MNRLPIQLPSKAHLRRPFGRAVASLLGLAMLAALATGCGSDQGSTVNPDEPGQRPQAADDATAQAVRAVAMATNRALDDTDAAPAPRNPLAARNGDEAPETGPYVVRGTESEPQAVAAAEAGRIGAPVLVWFHATWCQICRDIAPDMEQLRQDFADRVHFVKVDVDDPAADRAVRRFEVRGTPMFVLFDTDGRTAARMPGWPTRETMATYLEQVDE